MGWTPKTRRRKSFLDNVLDEWSDFAIDSWLMAFRFAGMLFVGLVISTLTGKVDLGAWANIWARWQVAGLIVSVAGVLLALALRVERAFAKQHKDRRSPANGGRALARKRPERRQRGNRKRKGRV
jgi:hypothetical protein